VAQASHPGTPGICEAEAARHEEVRSMKPLRLLVLALVLLSCASAPSSSDIAKLLANPRPAPGTPIEIDAYFSSVEGMSLSPETAADICFSTAVLTDKPMLPVLRVLNITTVNNLPRGMPRLIPMISPNFASTGGGAALPYHGRLRGHLDDPRYRQCPNAAQIFVVDTVLSDYGTRAPVLRGATLELPGAYSQWALYRDEQHQFQVRHPPHWQVDARTTSGGMQIVFGDRAATKPMSVTLNVRAGTWPEVPTFQQGWVFGQPLTPAAPLWADVMANCRSTDTTRTISTVFSADNRTYALTMTYPVGPDASQDVLTTYSAIVESFAIENIVTPPRTNAVIEGEPERNPTEADIAWACSTG
jgi:hypothetical protein